MIIKPPCRTLLYLSSDILALETSYYSTNSRIIIWVKWIKDCLRNTVHTGKGIKIISQFIGRSIIAYAVKTGINPCFFIHVCVIITLAAIMNLHNPVTFWVFLCNIYHKCCFKFHDISLRQYTCIIIKRHLKYVINFWLFSWSIHNIIKSMVTYNTAIFCKIIHSHR